MSESTATRVRQIIEESGKSQKEIAELVDIDASKLSKSLKGVRNFSSYELAAIAELGGRTVEWLLTGKEPRRLSFAHRTQIADRELVDNAGRAAANMIVERFDVAAQLGFAPEVSALPNAGVSSRYLETADRWARVALAELGEPIRHLDARSLLNRLEEAFGINAAVEELPDGVDGLSFANEAIRVVIVASTDRSGRQRFTIAHELAHVLFGDGGGEVIEEQLFLKDAGNVEARANAFAACFLMPQNEIEEVLSGREAVEVFNELVWAFRVSPDSMAWRLRNLGKVTVSDCRKLVKKTLVAVARDLKRLDDHGKRIRESSALRAPARLADAYIGAFLSGEVAAAPVAEVTGLSVEAVYRMREEISIPDEWTELFESDE